MIVENIYSILVVPALDSYTTRLTIFTLVMVGLNLYIYIYYSVESDLKSVSRYLKGYFELLINAVCLLTL